MVTKNAIKCYITKNYHLYPKLSELSLSANIIIIYLLVILALTKKKGSLARNIIDQAPEIILKPISKVTTFM